MIGTCNYIVILRSWRSLNGLPYLTPCILLDRFLLVIHGWSLYPSLGFTVTPLMADLVGAVDPFLTDIYSVIWKDCCPNKIKIFL